MLVSNSPRAVARRSAARLRHRQPSRSFGLGPWSRDCDGQGHSPRGLRYRYMETLNRRLSWENKPQHDAARAAMKSAFAHAVRPSSKYINVDEVKSWSDEFLGVRPGRNIEDVEREAIDHLFNGKAKAWTTPFPTLRTILHGKRGTAVTPESVLHATTTGPSAKENGDLNKYAPDKFDDPNAPRKPTPEEQSKNYDDLDKYKPIKWNEPDGLRKPTPEEESKNYKDLHKYGGALADAPVEPAPKPYSDLAKYKPVEWNEPDGLRQLTPEELSKQYDDLDKYGPVTWNEPDGLPNKTPEELSKNYQDLDKYGAVSWNEPDGLRKLTPEEESKKYDDLDKYSEGFMAKDSVLKAHEAAQQDPTPKAEPIPSKAAIAAAAPVPAQDPAEEYDDLDKYGPVHWNEPDGLRKPTPEELSKNYDDLDKYAQYPNAGPATPRIHPEEASKQYSDLRKYDAFPNDGPASERVHPEVASKEYKDLHKYPRAGFEEPAKTKHIHPEELTKNYKDLDKYKPSSFDAVDRAYPLHPEELTKNYEDLDKYKPVEFNEPDGKIAEASDDVAKSLKTYEKAGAETHDVVRSADEIRADVLRRAYRNSKRTMLQRANMRRDHDFDEPANTSKDTIRRAALTGNYARDFPEEFATSWSTESKPSLLPKGLPSADEAESEMSSFDESFPRESKLQSALDRKATAPAAEMQAQHSSVSHHEAKPESQNEVESASSGPVSYKTLAYDPSTQTISVAETTSAVHSNASPATPADVLVLLSHPAKFFPYFKALHAQGYEIVSGGGDVLVFRQSAKAAAAVAANVSYRVPRKRGLGRKVVVGTAGVVGFAYGASVVAEFFATGGKVF